MHFDGTVTLGSLMTTGAFVLSLVVLYNKGTLWLAGILARLQGTLDEHAKQLVAHNARMDRYEQCYVKIVGDLQFVIGHIGADRRLGKD